MFALALTFHLLQPALAMPARAPRIRLLALADDAPIAPPPVLSPEPQPAAPGSAPIGLSLGAVDLHAGGVGMADVAAAAGGVALGHVSAFGLGLAITLIGDAIDHPGGDFISTGEAVGALVALVADVLLVPALATEFGGLVAGDAIAGSKLSGFLRGLVVHSVAWGLLFACLVALPDAGGAIAVAVAVVDLIATPLATSWGLHDGPSHADEPGASPAAALRTEMPALGGLAFAR